MSKVIAGMTISLDGFVNDSSGSVASLYSDLETYQNTEPYKESIQNTGAVIMGKNTFEMSNDPEWYVDYEFQVPIFVLTHTLPAQQPKPAGKVSITFVLDGVESAVKQAKSAAGIRDVAVIGGASVTRQCIKAGLVDELQIDIMPILLGGGLRLFEGSEAASIQLDRINVVNLPGGRIHMKFRV
ncbi:MAG: dihydrofolate reductase family protein [Chloroflexi bacterium]|nr:dihydrofolate reductase family protein [Chloroflexota bacterium]